MEVHENVFVFVSISNVRTRQIIPFFLKCSIRPYDDLENSIRNLQSMQSKTRTSKYCTLPSIKDQDSEQTEKQNFKPPLHNSLLPPCFLCFFRCFTALSLWRPCGCVPREYQPLGGCLASTASVVDMSLATAIFSPDGTWTA